MLEFYAADLARAPDGRWWVLAGTGMVVAAAVTYLVVPAARRLAERVNAMTPVRERDVHTVPTPRLGGLAMYGAFEATLGAGKDYSSLLGVFWPLVDRLADGKETIVEDVVNFLRWRHDDLDG